MFDGTYFHKNGCLALFINVKSGKPVLFAYIERESYENVLPLARQLRAKNVYPVAITTDGHTKVIDALKEVWQKTTLQRCLFHIQNQGLMWLRSYPKSEAGITLRRLFGTIASIRTTEEMNTFKISYTAWLNKYKTFVVAQPSNVSVYKDLKRAMSLIKNALPNMFHFLANKNIAATTNILESFYSQVKHQYARHRGLTEQHKISYLKWFCYFKTLQK